MKRLITGVIAGALLLSMGLWAGCSSIEAPETTVLRAYEELDKGSLKSEDIELKSVKESGKDVKDPTSNHALYSALILDQNGQDSDLSGYDSVMFVQVTQDDDSELDGVLVSKDKDEDAAVYWNKGFGAEE